VLVRELLAVTNWRWIGPVPQLFQFPGAKECPKFIQVKQFNLNKKEIKNMTTLHTPNSVSRSPLRRGLSVIALALACFALSPDARAVCRDACGTNDNTYQGDDALASITTGTDNTAFGYQAVYSTATGSRNTGTGSRAFSSSSALNPAGNDNTATGYQALYAAPNANYNTATGSVALENNTGDNNTGIGYGALSGNTSGTNNIALGAKAGTNLTTGSNNIDIGNTGVAAETKTIRIGTQGTQGATYVAGIYGLNVGSTGTTVYINSSGQLGTIVSSARFKRDIRSMDKASETILALRPVTFRYKKEIDPDGSPQFGLVAEEVEKVNPALVVRDADGKPYSVRYEAVNAMLLNEFLKEHQKIAEQQATIAELKSTVAHEQTTFQSKFAQQEKQIEALTSGLQKVSAQLKVSKSRPQMASNAQ
jgi:uncharacterized coiled-coil protein SlyX